MALRLSCMRVRHTGFVNQILDPATILDGLLDFRCQFVRDINRKPTAATTPVTGHSWDAPRLGHSLGSSPECKGCCAAIATLRQVATNPGSPPRNHRFTCSGVSALIRICASYIVTHTPGQIFLPRCARRCQQRPFFGQLFSESFLKVGDKEDLSITCFCPSFAPRHSYRVAARAGRYALIRMALAERSRPCSRYVGHRQHGCHQSHLKAAMGSTRAARRAGIHDAVRAAPPSTEPLATNVQKSVAPTP
jgi:hypothetical protein